IQLPIRVVPFHPLPLFNVSRTERAVRYERTADGGVAVQPNAIEMHYQRIARPSTFDIERTSQRIAPRGAPDAFRVRTASVNRPGLHGVTRIHMQRRHDCTGKEMLELGWLEHMGLRWRRVSGRLTANLPLELDLT